MKQSLRAIAGVVTVCLVLVMCTFEGNCAQIRDAVVRLHVLANSDTAEDQALKLRVRDAVLSAGATLFADTTSREQAEQKIQTALPQIQKAAAECVQQQGYNYPVTAKLTESYFSTRTYENGTFPAGRYKTVQIVIGEGKGKNWWCVMYPPLCVAAATDRHTLSDTLGEKQCHIIEQAPRYVVRFKVVEWLSALFSWFEK